MENTRRGDEGCGEGLAVTASTDHEKPRFTTLFARVLLGGLFVYLGAIKALDPVAFLKQVHAFQVLGSPLALNLTAGLLPWAEVACGAFLLIGWQRRGAALLALVMLLGFTALIVLRAWTIYRAGGVALCSIRFDCGCGTGEVVACWKVLQNAGLTAVAAYLVAARR